VAVVPAAPAYAIVSANEALSGDVIRFDETALDLSWRNTRFARGFAVQIVPATAR
jgi:hypothetical protein